MLYTDLSVAFFFCHNIPGSRQHFWLMLPERESIKAEESWWKGSGGRKLRDHIFIHQHEAEWTGSEAKLLPLKACPEWQISSSMAALPHNLLQSTTNWGTGVQIHEYMRSISHPNHHTHTLCGIRHVVTSCDPFFQHKFYVLSLDLFIMATEWRLLNGVDTTI